MHNPESVLENVTHKILWDFYKRIILSRPFDKTWCRQIKQIEPSE